MAKKSVSTLAMSHEDWLASRRQGVGGSDIGVILGLNKYKTPLQLFNEKIGAVVPDDLSGNPAVEFGNRLEDVVAQKFMDDTGLKVVRDNKIRIHSKYPWAIGNIDRVIVGDGSPTGPGVLEIKTASSFAMKSWDAEYSLDHFAQLQWYLFVTGYKYGYIALLIDGRYFRCIRIERDEKYIEILFEAAKQFQSFVEAKEPPPAEVPDVEAMLADPGTLVEASDEIITAISAANDWSAKRDEADKMRKMYREQIELFMEKRESLTQGGMVIATFKNIFKKAYTVEAKTIRQLRLKSSKGE